MTIGRRSEKGKAIDYDYIIIYVSISCLIAFPFTDLLYSFILADKVPLIPSYIFCVFSWIRPIEVNTSLLNKNIPSISSESKRINQNLLYCRNSHHITCVASLFVHIRRRNSCCKNNNITCLNILFYLCKFNCSLTDILCCVNFE